MMIAKPNAKVRALTRGITVVLLVSGACQAEETKSQTPTAESKPPTFIAEKVESIDDKKCAPWPYGWKLEEHFRGKVLMNAGQQVGSVIPDNVFNPDTKPSSWQIRPTCFAVTPDHRFLLVGYSHKSRSGGKVPPTNLGRLRLFDISTGRETNIEITNHRLGSIVKVGIAKAGATIYFQSERHFIDGP